MQQHEEQIVRVAHDRHLLRATVDELVLVDVKREHIAAKEARKLREKQKKMRSNGVALALNQSSVSGRHRLLAASKKTNDRTAPNPEAAMNTPKPSEPTLKMS